MRLRRAVVAANVTKKELSIPLWCDCDDYGLSDSDEVEMLSIPLWCDCDLATLRSPTIGGTFNPTVVRLRQGKLAETDSDIQLSIPLWCDCDWYIQQKFALEQMLSIPLWCDCDRARDERRRKALLLSIPLWCDCDLTNTTKAIGNRLLSIPLWCDCDQPKRHDRLFHQVTFNPTVVRLRRVGFV